MNITNDKVTAYIDGLYHPLNEQLAALREEAEKAGVPIILRDTETFLLNLLRIRKPLTILEIGTAIGYSAACMAVTCPSSRIITIEADAQACMEARENLEKMGLSDRVEVLYGPGQVVLDQLLGPFDFVFIDASKSHYRTFWDKAVPLCCSDAMIICDNVLMKGMTVSEEYDPRQKHKTHIRNLREFLTYITQTNCADTSVLPIGDGVSFSVLRG
ncbi:O-methyltransferase [Anaerovorax odorimutans]|uniref:O-methyltransferase n=1 Tax=Anaerovorax odorimutans TaxID=109327 RepID=A0ABT1RL35_9FIRM|nr:O-methyltransferase [Anaerovorax odorimutans]MCQ4635899.1 O-methyltransferase [Anaerovorax odorimutans]